MNCPKCGKETRVLLLTVRGQECRECKALASSTGSASNAHNPNIMNIPATIHKPGGVNASIHVDQRGLAGRLNYSVENPTELSGLKDQEHIELTVATDKSPPMAIRGFKFEHILISVTIAHNREIGQFDDSCARQVEKGMSEYQGILMVDAKAQYRHCSEQQHVEGCDCGLCQQVRQNDKAE